HGSPEKFSQGVSTELVRPFFQNFKIPNWLSICLSVFHSITTSQTQRSVKYGQDRVSPLLSCRPHRRLLRARCERPRRRAAPVIREKSQFRAQHGSLSLSPRS